MHEEKLTRTVDPLPFRMLVQAARFRGDGSTFRVAEFGVEDRYVAVGGVPREMQTKIP
jgi:hypothetical protein